MKNICAFGDSVLKGVVLDEDKKRYRITQDSFSNTCQNVFGIKIDNQGKFGSTIKKGEAILQKYIQKIKKYEYVIFEFGGNDCDFNWKEISKNPQIQHKPKSTLKEFHNIYTELIKQIKKIGSTPVLLSLPPINAQRYFQTISKDLNGENILKWMNGNVEYINSWHEMYNLEIFKIAMETNTSIIDITSKFLECNNYQNYLCKDGIHPNEKGHEIIAKAIKEYIETKFESIEKWKNES